MRQSPIRLVSDFINTAVLGTGSSEVFESNASLGTWLYQRGLLHTRTRVTEADRKRVIACREALRSLLIHKREPSPHSHVCRTLERQASRSRLALDFHAGDVTLTPHAQGVDGALGIILAGILAAVTNGSWRRLRACPNSTCHMAFVDRSRNGSKVWCEMAICGNRIKARRFRQRRRRGRHGKPYPLRARKISRVAADLLRV